MHLVTELLADRRKLEQIKKRCIEAQGSYGQSTSGGIFARELIEEFFSEPEVSKNAVQPNLLA